LADDALANPLNRDRDSPCDSVNRDTLCVGFCLAFWFAIKRKPPAH
jgi:hypothetical protein